MAALLRVADIGNTNYFVLNSMLGHLPDLKPVDRPRFLLKNLQFVRVINNPSFPKRVAAIRLKAYYLEGGYAINDVTDFFVNPGNRSMKDLARFIKSNHVPLP